MTYQKNSYSELEYEVKKFKERIIREVKISSRTNQKDFESYFKGIQVLFSPLKYKPKIMLIGINPGSGYFDWVGKPVKRYKPLNFHEYFHYDYNLARQTREVFDSIDRLDILEGSVKTNVYYFATKSESELRRLKT